MVELSLSDLESTGFWQTGHFPPKSLLTQSRQKVWLQVSETCGVSASFKLEEENSKISTNMSTLIFCCTPKHSILFLFIKDQNTMNRSLEIFRSSRETSDYFPI